MLLLKKSFSQFCICMVLAIKIASYRKWSLYGCHNNSVDQECMLAAEGGSCAPATTLYEILVLDLMYMYFNVI